LAYSWPFSKSSTRQSCLKGLCCAFPWKTQYALRARIKGLNMPSPPYTGCNVMFNAGRIAMRKFD